MSILLDPDSVPLSVSAVPVSGTAASSTGLAVSPVGAEGAEAANRQRIGMLARQILDMESSTRPKGECFSSGCSAMDRLLPGGGYSRGSMLELLTESRNPVGATSIALRIAKEACASGKYLVLVDSPVQYFPPALKSMGIPLERVICLQPKTHSDWVWAVDQVFRNAAVGCVIGAIDRLDDRTARRLQLGIETGGGLGILLRPASVVRTEPSWAAVQWHVASRAQPENASSRSAAQGSLESLGAVRWFQMQLRRSQGGRSGGSVCLGIDTAGNWVEPIQSEGRYVQTSHMHLAAELAKPTRDRRDVAS